MIAAVNLSQIGELVVYAAGAGIAVALVFAFALTGTVRAGEARREGRSGALVGWGAVAAVSLAAFAGLCVLGIVFISTK
jgi:hypothetical protein